uniref:HTH_48 domain-containing protein n=1 Tax=Haemonchus contortus TaxID=6289 RepID=A0A7I4XXB0_HAECO
MIHLADIKGGHGQLSILNYFSTSTIPTSTFFISTLFKNQSSSNGRVMELNRGHFRAIIFYKFRRGLTQQQCMDELSSIAGDEAPPRASVYRWSSEFTRGRSSLEDEFLEVDQNQYLFRKPLFAFVAQTNTARPSCDLS